MKNMITKYTFGTPIETDAVVNKLKTSQGQIPYVTVKEGSLTYHMEQQDIVYGLGEQLRGLNKRGWIYESNCTDQPTQTEEKRSLYGAHNFIILDGKEHFGLFLDTPGIVTFDIGYTDPQELVISFAEPDFDCYVIQGPDSAEITGMFRELIGRSYIPPKWAFGYGQSRWSYMNADEVREVVAKHRDAHIPLDSVYLDIDYMERYKDFTVNGDTFPDFKSFVKEMRAQHIHLVPIIDAGVKIEEGYPTYEAGLAGDYFCNNENGELFIAGVWPGKVHFPDVLDEKARTWFGDKYRVLLDQGIDGFWNDMNEPAIFYSEDHLKEVFDQIDEYKKENLDIIKYFEFSGVVGGCANRKEDYASFYHHYKGQRIRHDKVHNLYGYHMTRAAGEAFDRAEPDKRILIFSRASYIGMHRYGGIWTGDNCAWWSHLALNIRMMSSLNMCGFLYSGADLGGFGGNTTSELMLRWLEFGIFTPLMRNHAAQGTRRKEVYQFAEMDAYRNIIGLRYGLLPYIYSEFMKAALQNQMYMRPLAFDYKEDVRAKEVEDQLLVGESIMIAPVYEQNARGRYVYLPEEMKLYRMRSITDWEETILPAGDHYLSAAIDEVLLFIRPDHMVPLAAAAESVEELYTSSLQFLQFVKTRAEYALYDDDGYTKEYDLKKNSRVFYSEPEE